MNASGAQERADSHSRYLGTRPFRESARDTARFFGRSEETTELYLRVLSVPFLVQFGKSGLGKTSLLQAGLFPRLRKEPFLPVMVRLNVADESLTAAVTRGIAESCAAEGLQYTPPATPDSLWHLLADLAVWREGLFLTPVLVFDQFEEVFTLRDAAFRAALASELGSLARGAPPGPPQVSPAARPDAKVVISIREDYLGSLEEFSAAIPGLFHERLRLEAMRETSARAAITEPARLQPSEGELPFRCPPFAYDEQTLEAMIAYLRGHSGVIEPFELQLLCRHAEKLATARFRGGAQDVTLTLADFHGGRDFQSILANFYRDTIMGIPSRSQRRRAMRLCEEKLLSRAGNRVPVGA